MIVRDECDTCPVVLLLLCVVAGVASLFFLVDGIESPETSGASLRNLLKLVALV